MTLIRIEVRHVGLSIMYFPQGQKVQWNPIHFSDYREGERKGAGKLLIHSDPCLHGTLVCKHWKLHNGIVIE